ncbi:MAG: Minf_1886 family protein [Opitutia bacterium]|jgi:uncharacterized repeat protein (TIGR04138 family)
MDIDEVIRACVAKDPRYRAQAYHAVRLGLDQAQRSVHGEPRKGAKASARSRHVSGPQMLEGFRHHCLEAYGPMAYPLLANWGVRKTSDVGNIVFNLIEGGFFGKSDEDSPADFSNVFDFKEAFAQPFVPGRN